METGLLQDYDDTADPRDYTMTPSRKPFRERLHFALESLALQWTIVTLIFLDTFFVLTDLILELEILALSEEHKTSHFMHILEQALRFGSIAILSLFIVELVLKLYAKDALIGLLLHSIADGPRKFSKSIGHVFDSMIVIASWIFEVFFAHENGFALIIVFRLWRIIRIVHGVIETAQSKLKTKIDKLQKRVDELEDQLIVRDKEIEREREIREGVEEREKTYRARLEALDARVVSRVSVYTPPPTKDIQSTPHDPGATMMAEGIE